MTFCIVLTFCLGYVVLIFHVLRLAETLHWHNFVVHIEGYIWSKYFLIETYWIVLSLSDIGILLAFQSSTFCRSYSKWWLPWLKIDDIYVLRYKVICNQKNWIIDPQIKHVYIGKDFICSVIKLIMFQLKNRWPSFQL